jgi:hypothetical protein
MLGSRPLAVAVVVVAGAALAAATGMHAQPRSGSGPEGPAGGLRPPSGAPPPARVWIDGHDIDGPPPGPYRLPGFLGGSVWPTGVRSAVRARAPGAAATTQGSLNAITGINGTVAGRLGLYSAELDVFSLNQTVGDAIVFGGTGFAAGSSLSQNDVVLRAARQMEWWKTPWGQYNASLGLRLTSAARTADAGAGGASTRLSRLFIGPEVTLAGRWVMADFLGVHARVSYATTASTGEGERALEGQVMLNYHLLATDGFLHDVGLGFRVLSVSLGFADAAGNISRITNVYIGPEVAYAGRF